MKEIHKLSTFTTEVILLEIGMIAGGFKKKLKFIAI